MDFGKGTTTRRKRKRTPLATAKVARARGGAVQIRLSAEEASKLGLVAGQTLVFTSKRRFRAQS